MSFKEDVKALATEYLNSYDEVEDANPSSMLVDFVIEKYKQHRNFPNTFNDEKIEEDMIVHKSTIAMAIVDIYMKAGAEGEVSHSENGVARTYQNAYLSRDVFGDVLPFVKVL